MTGSLLAILGLSLFALGYKVYSKYLAKEIYSTDDEIELPSKEFVFFLGCVKRGGFNYE